MRRRTVLVASAQNLRANATASANKNDASVGILVNLTSFGCVGAGESAVDRIDGAIRQCQAVECDFDDARLLARGRLDE